MGGIMVLIKMTMLQLLFLFSELALGSIFASPIVAGKKVELNTLSLSPVETSNLILNCDNSNLGILKNYINKGYYVTSLMEIKTNSRVINDQTTETRTSYELKIQKDDPADIIQPVKQGPILNIIKVVTKLMRQPGARPRATYACSFS